MPESTRSAALLIAAAAFLAFLDQTVPRRGPELIALAAIAGFLLLSRRRLGKLALAMIAASLAGTVAFFLGGHTFAEFSQIATRCVYLPALITVLVPLRLTAMEAPMVGSAGLYIVYQPPARRFALLALGSQIFGVLLNIGGLLLLAQVALRDLLAHNRADRVNAIQTRRISTAILRGFAASMFWSPLGLGLNLLLSITPGVTWSVFLPYGLVSSALFVLTACTLDALEHPARSGKRRAAVASRGTALSVVGFLLVLVAISGLAALPEWLIGLPFRAALLVAIPLFALGWRLADRFAAEPAAKSARDLVAATLQELPRRANETGVIFAAGYLGLVIAAILPVEGVVRLAETLGLSGASLACAVCLTVFVTSVAGLSPMISATICVGAIVSADLPLPTELLLMSTLTGWALAVVVSPATASVTIVAGVADRPVPEVGLRWNALFCAAVLALAMLSFLILWN